MISRGGTRSAGHLGSPDPRTWPYRTGPDGIGRHRDLAAPTSRSLDHDSTTRHNRRFECRRPGHHKYPHCSVGPDDCFRRAGERRATSDLVSSRRRPGPGHVLSWSTTRGDVPPPNRRRIRRATDGASGQPRTARDGSPGKCTPTGGMGPRRSGTAGTGNLLHTWATEPRNASGEREAPPPHLVHHLALHELPARVLS